MLLTATAACTARDNSATDGAAPASHHARVLAAGKLAMLCFPVQESDNVRPRLEVLAERGVPLAELRDADAFEGIDVDLIRGFAEELGVELEIVSITTSYQELIDAVVDGRGDLAASSLSITEKRLEIVDFSAPYATMWAVVAAPFDSSIDSLDDLSGRRGRGLRGSSQVEIFRTLAPADVELELGDFSMESYAEALAGNTEFLLMDSNAAVGESVSEAFSDVKVAVRLRDTNFGVAFPKGSDLRPRFDDYLARRMAAATSG